MFLIKMKGDQSDPKNLCEAEAFIEDISRLVAEIIRFKFTRNPPEQKEDIAQEVRLKIWKMISRGKKITNLKSYLWKVVVTTALDVMRSHSVLPSSEENLQNEILERLFSAGVSNPVEQAEKKERIASILEAVESLAENRRLVLKMTMAGMDVRDIAVHLGWTMDKVNHLYYRGIDDLKSLMVKVPGEKT